jgi:hypothetical protein
MAEINDSMAGRRSDPFRDAAVRPISLMVPIITAKFLD